jgi:hypothetical protein
MATPQLPVSPAIATIDQDFFLVVNWNPPAIPQGYNDYLNWNIWVEGPPFTPPGVLQLVNGHKPTGLEFPGSEPSARIYQTQLSAGDYGMNMQAENANSDYTNSPLWNVSTLNPNGSPALLLFPTSLQATDVTLNNTTLELGQTVTVTLGPDYPETGAGANFWQILWPDNTSTGPLPLSSRSAAKSFTTAGSFNIIVQTWNDYSSFIPPVKLLRSLSLPILVVDVQFNPQQASQGSLTGTLGFGGQTEFEIVGTGGVVQPEPYAVIARTLVRDTVTNELKLAPFVSRFSNASSELGSMAGDVFPLEGRPHAKELIVPEEILQVTPTTTASPATVTTTTLPSVIVGKPMPQFKMQAIGGLPSYSWFNDGTLPPGLQMSIDGTISGTAVELGTFQVNFAAMDSGTPPFIAETTLPMTIATDLIITTTTIPNAQVLTPYSQQIAFTGGLAPYTWSIAAGALPIGLSINSLGLLNGTPCTYNSTTDYSINFTATVQVTDAIGAVATKTYTITLSPAPLQFAPVIDQERIFPQQDFVMAVAVFGGFSPYTFHPSSFLPGDTYVDPGQKFFSDGRVEFRAGNVNDSPPNPIPVTAVGVHNIAFAAGAIVDSEGNNSPLTGLSYVVGQQISDLRMAEAFFNYYWGFNDVSTADIIIVGDLQGFTLNPVALSLSNGLDGSIIPASSPTVLNDGVATVNGPPALYQNTELRFPLQMLQGLQQIAQISRPYTLLAHNNSSPFASDDVGSITTYTHPYVVGDFVGLNPRKPNLNSPTPDVISSFTPFVALGSPPVSIPLTAEVEASSSLPEGLSLDSNTGLIYGYLLGVASGPSVINYVDSSGLIHGTITINWSTVASAFSLINNGGLDDLVFGTTYGAGSPPTGIEVFTSPNIEITSVSTFNAYNLLNALPLGLSVSTDGTNVIVTGTPVEAGYFDVWFAATSANNGTAYAYYRVSVDFVVPLVILTQSLPTISAQLYTTFLAAFGGVPPYTWGASDMVNGSWAVSGGIAAPTVGNFVGLTLNISTGKLTGTLASPPGASPTDLGNITFILTDSRGATTTAALDLTYNNNLRIVTDQIATVTNDPTGYSFKVQGAGGVPPYTWQMNNIALPSGITFTATAPNPPATETTTPPGGGWFYGTWPGTSYSPTPVIITLNDSHADGPVNESFTIRTGVWTFTINSSGVNQISRGIAYQGTLIAEGTFVTPVQWEIAPSSTYPNLLPTGLTLQVNGTGGTATISGNYTGAFLTSYPVRVVAVDVIGNTAEAVLMLSTNPNSVTITTTSLPNAIDTVSYQNTGFQLTATGGVTPYTWVISPMTPGYINPSTIPTSGGIATGLTLSSSGVISGVTNIVWTNTIYFVASDSLSPANTSVPTPLSLTAQAAGLTITTTQAQLNANEPLSGQAYSMTFAAAGDPNTPYTWGISPLSENQLPTGLTILANSSTTGLVSGTTNDTGYSKPVTIRVTDNIGAYTDGTFTFTVSAPLALLSGIDFEDGTSNFFLGYVDNGAVGSITTRPNQSFVVVATGVTTKSSSGLQASVNYPNVTATPQTPGTINGVSVPGAAAIILSGTGFNQAPGNYSFVLTLTEGQIIVSQTFKWTVYNHGSALTLFPALPTENGAPYIPILERTSGSLELQGFIFPQVVDDPTAATASLSLSGNNTAYSGLLSVSAPAGNSNEPTFVFGYNGGAIVSGIASTNLTISAKDVAWFDSSNKSYDVFPVGQGGLSLGVVVDYLANPSPFVAGVSPTTHVADGSTINFSITLTKPLSPQQQGTGSGTNNTIGITVTWSGGITTNSITPVENGAGFLIGWTVNATLPLSGTTTNASMIATIQGDLTRLSGVNTFVRNNFLYVNNATIATITLTGDNLIPPQFYSFVYDQTQNGPDTWGGTLTATVYNFTNVSNTVGFLARKPGGTQYSTGGGVLINSYTGQVNGETVFFKVYSGEYLTFSAFNAYLGFTCVDQNGLQMNPVYWTPGLNQV